MYDLCPYFTNDGTVGLFSRLDDDIYHSTYGALTESWQKFILPANLPQYIDEHNEVRILDICYGIGYNTKTSLQVFISNYFKNKKNNLKKYNENNVSQNTNIDAIYSDNISKGSYNEKCKNKQNFHNNTNLSIGKIDVDNIANEEIRSVEKNNIIFANEEKVNHPVSEINSKKILIDAVDTDKILMNISPFITREFKGVAFSSRLRSGFKSEELNSKNKLEQIKKIKNNKMVPLPKKMRITKIVSMILIINLLKQNPELLEDKIINSLLSLKSHSSFFDKYIVNFTNFLSNFRSNNKQKAKISTFLHNIYYRYVSKSYKAMHKLQQNTQIDVNFHNMDARSFIGKSDYNYNFIFLDAFTPAKCPALWSLEFFSRLYDRLADDGMILTYSNSAAVRHAFLKNGFSVGKIFDEKLNKFIGTIAVKDPALIKYVLNQKDLDLISSKAGICYRDENLNLDNAAIIANREQELADSKLVSSSKVLKGYKNDNVEQL